MFPVPVMNTKTGSVNWSNLLKAFLTLPTTQAWPGALMMPGALHSLAMTLGTPEPTVLTRQLGWLERPAYKERRLVFTVSATRSASDVTILLN